MPTCIVATSGTLMTSIGLKILVMDDESAIADSLVRILNLFGHIAVAVYNPVEALEWLSRNPCDVLISDVIVPGHISGIDLAIQLRTALPQLRVLLVSGNNATAELLQAAQQLGHSFDILAKPVHPSVILQQLQTVPPIPPLHFRSDLA
jgi:DNA-binding NtrC family response regulator